MGVIPGWSNQRFLKLCSLINRTPEELGAFAGLEPAETRRFMARDLFPPPVTLHFVLIDAVMREVLFGEPFVLPVPLDLLDEKP